MVDPSYDIQEDVHDIEHPIFKIKYRSNSIISSGGLSDKDGDLRLPVIKVLGTGGTIASKGSSSFQTAGYEVDLTIQDLINTIPDLSTTCELQYEQIMNIDSKEIGTAELQHIYLKVVESIEECDGIVITHGTDTCEETAFFLESTVNTPKPIVICGSMRPSTAISSDGPMNLYQAIVVAADKRSRRRGVLVALNDRIGSGYYITKSDANSLDTFKSLGQGYLGNFVNNEVHYYFPPNKPSGMTNFYLNENQLTGEFAEVPVIFAHQGLNNQLIELAINQLDAKGLVLATMGAGSMSDATNKFICQISTEKKIPVIYSKRSMDGTVPIGALPKMENNTFLVASGYLNPQKSRLLLQLCLDKGLNIHEIRRTFGKH